MKLYEKLYEMIEQRKLLTKYFDDPTQRDIETALGNGAYASLTKILHDLQPDDVIEEITKSGLRGRGGAGFPTGRKWDLVRRQSEKTKYLCCNADEGEPGTFKDRLIIETDPHLLLEGIAICCYAVGIERAYIYLRGEFIRAAEILQKAIDDANRKGFSGESVLGEDFSYQVTVHRGAGSYVCGEETALIESLEGKRGQPRPRPPYPASIGLFGRPTVVNNVETLANIPRIIEKGADHFASIGRRGNTGTRLFSVSGHVETPGLYEFPLGVPLSHILEIAGGLRHGNKPKAFFPGGCSTPVLSPEDIDIRMDFDSLSEAGSSAGTGAVIVMDETVCLVRIARRILEFFFRECCGQCAPGRIGIALMYDIVNRIVEGKGTQADLESLLEIGGFLKRSCLCELGKSAPNSLMSTIRRFRHEYESHVIDKTCPAGECRFEMR